MSVFTETSRPIVNALPKALIKHPNLWYLTHTPKLTRFFLTYTEDLTSEMTDWDKDKIERIATLMAWSTLIDTEFPGANTIEAFRK